MRAETAFWRSAKASSSWARDSSTSMVEAPGVLTAFTARVIKPLIALSMANSGENESMVKWTRSPVACCISRR